MNIYEYFAMFNKKARRAGWSEEQRKEVIDRAKQGNYEEAQAVILDAIGQIA